ncbi:MAG: UDP-2,3-diacylglucosamine diphosphatase [Rubrivivax sp.]|nr:UDP-2,3-diacylglucosamine diphosphatase [Rubrivivax sp.]
MPAGAPGTVATAAALPAPPVFTAPATWRSIDFISDLHLSEAMPRTFAALAAHLDATGADAVFILGDLFELWVGDDARSQPFAARCIDLLARAGRRLHLAVMTGNRDFLIGSSLLAACHAHALPDPTLLVAFGRRVLLSHGDALCLADRDYQAFRAQVRDAAWQRSFLARPLPQRLAMAREIRQASHASQMRRQFDGALAADADRTEATAWLRAANAATLVHGHTHRPGSEAWPGGFERHVLSDWDLDAAARAEVLRLDAGGFTRVPPAGLAAAC